jgi:hypothetical protein
MTLVDDRLENLILARMKTSPRPLAPPEIANALYRFAPPSFGEPAWRDRIEGAVADLASRGIGPDDLGERLGKHVARTWAHYVERLFPALALGIEPGDAKAHAKLSGRDAWTAAIAGRALGLWTDGPPPSLSSVCDAYAWRQLGLAGRAKRCPPEVRAVFLQRELGADPGPPDRLLRLYAARSLDAPRPELRALRDALVRRWLLSGSFADEVRHVARAARDGVFGERKVFIAAVWDALRHRPGYASLTLDDFKARLLQAHRAGALVLARADLVAAMNTDLVTASETAADGATFHFVVRETA